VRLTRWITLGICVIGCVRGWSALQALAAAPAETREPPVVAGLRESSLTAIDRGSILLHELGCIHCHRASPDDVVGWDARRGPDLTTAGERLRGDYLERFIADPGVIEPGSTMPSLLHGLPASARAESAAALAEYVRSLAKQKVANAGATPPIPATPTDQDIEHGRTLYHEIGCVACHAPRDGSGDEIAITDSEPLPDLAAKYSTASLRAFLLDPESARPGSRMPNFRLTPVEATELTSYLRGQSDGERARPADDARGAIEPLDETKIARGRGLFAMLGCAACHTVGDAQHNDARNAPPLRNLAGSTAGCLAAASGRTPSYGLSEAQRSDLSAALASLEAPVSEEQQIRRALTARQCLACHTRGESGGISSERNPYFTTNDASLGEHGRVPPTLSLTGAKLQSAWLADAIAFGQSIRPYLNTRMPGFGAEFGQAIATRLARADTLPPLVLPEPVEDDEQRGKTRALGSELVGENGMNCIMCHSFAGDRVGPVGALDLIDSTGQRLRREWFHHFMLAPTAVSPGTLMPEYYVAGVSTRPDVGGGDSTTQIDAMWEYLAEGRNARRPPGLRQPPLELTVENEAVLLRRSAQGSGKRAINVGYPGGVNLVFDAESLAVTRIWWGDFIDASGVWYGQGSGETRPLSERLAKFPRGPVFARLETEDAPWPLASRRDLGGQWLGYDLDAQQQPTFRYSFEGVTIADRAAPFVITTPGNRSATTVLRRVLEFEAESGANGGSNETLHFLVARDARIELLEPGRVVVGESLVIAMPAGSEWIRDSDRGRELIATITPAKNRAELTIEYSWLKGGR
jgi:mono/diheme cytochrome c family protein